MAIKLEKNAAGRLVPTEVNGREAVPFAGVGGRVVEVGSGEPVGSDVRLSPAFLNALKQASEENQSISTAMQQAAAAGKEGMLATIPLVARKGRASYLGERSAGHQDPGATSSYYLLQSAANAWTNA